jgi:hypothetical protein
MQRFVALALLALLLSPASRAEACVCNDSGDLAADYREAAAVFAGRVVAFEVVTSKIAGREEEEMVATLEVERRWNGPKAGKIRVRTCGTQEMLCTCGTDFRLGARFIVFAVDAPLYTGSCQRTREYQRIRGDASLQWLGAEDLVRDLDALDRKSR